MFSRAQKRVFDIVIGIHSDVMCVLIVETETIEKKPIIHYYTHERIRDYSLNDSEDAFHALKEALLSITLSLAQNGYKKMRDLGGHIHPQSMFVIAGAPYGATVTRTISLCKEEPFAVTVEFVRKLIEEAEAQSDSKSAEIAVYSEHGMHVSNRLMTNAKLNGYPVKSFTGQHATELVLSEIVEVVSSIIGETFKEAEKNLLPHVPIIEHTFSLAVASFLKNLYPHTKDFMVLDFHSKGTECFLIEDNALVEHKNSNYGFSNAAAHLSETIGTISGEGELHLKEFGLDTMYEDTHTAVLSEVETHAVELKTLISNLHLTHVLPKDIFVIHSMPYEKYTDAVIKSAVPSEYRTANYTTHHLTQTEIDDLVIMQLDIAEPLSVSALILAKFVHMERNRTAKDTATLAVY